MHFAFDPSLAGCSWACGVPRTLTPASCYPGQYTLSLQTLSSLVLGESGKWLIADAWASSNRKEPKTKRERERKKNNYHLATILCKCASMQTERKWRDSPLDPCRDLPPAQTPETDKSCPQACVMLLDGYPWLMSAKHCQIGPLPPLPWQVHCTYLNTGVPPETYQCPATTDVHPPHGCNCYALRTCAWTYRSGHPVDVLPLLLCVLHLPGSLECP